ncbi:2-oxo/hydroxy acid reductase [Hyaloraphidium curvatum]|nr:2-oxo/hydroxy acid reductase [Hyaloraphidium curvatum]
MPPPVCLVSFHFPPLVGPLTALGLELAGPFATLADAPGDVLERAEVFVVHGGFKVTDDQLALAPKLALVAAIGVGYETIDLAACRARGIAVANCPGSNSSCVADMCFALVLATVRRVLAADAYVRTGQWAPETKEGKPMFAIRHKPSPGMGGLNIGILGMGDIGERVAKRAKAFEMNVAYCNRNSKEGADPDYKFFESPMELAKWSNVLAVCLRADASNRHIVDAAMLDALGPDGYVVNISRGSAIDQEALVRYLKEGKLAGAGLDVFEAEPEVPPELFEMGRDGTGGGPYVVLTPHYAPITARAFQLMTEAVIANVTAFVKGETVPYPVPEMKDLANVGRKG